MTKRKPESVRWSFTAGETRTLLILGGLLLLGLVGRQVLRHGDEAAPVTVKGAPAAAVVDSAAVESGGHAPVLESSPPLAPSPSGDVTSALSSTRTDERKGRSESSHSAQDSALARLPQIDETTVRTSGGELPSTGGDPEQPGSTRFDLNRATRAELESLPGIGQVLASRILDWRAEHGAYQRVEDLLLVDGIGEKRLATLKKHVYVQP